MLTAVLALALGGLDLCGGRTGCELTVTAEPELLAPARAALDELGLKAQVAEREPQPKAEKKPADAKLAYRVSRREGEVVVTLRSLDRPIGVYGEGRSKPTPVPRKEWEARALKVAVKSAMERAAIDFRARAREQDLGRRSIGFSLRVAGLNDGARGEAKHALQCLKGQLDLAGPVTEASEHAGYLDESVEYVPKADEPRDNLPYFSQRVRDWLLSGPRAPCSLAGSSLARLTVRVDTDELNHAVVVSFLK